jgi:hypothetical protein
MARAKIPETVDKVFILNQNKPDNPNTSMQYIDKLRDIEDNSTADRLTPEILEKLKQLELEDIEAK